MSKISPLAFVNPEAKLGENVTIDAFAFIDKDVEIGLSLAKTTKNILNQHIIKNAGGKITVQINHLYQQF